MSQLDLAAVVDAVREASAEGRSAAVLEIQKRATRDLPTDEDMLGIAPLVEGLRALLDDCDTSLPLAIGVSAPWGAGKSSLMLQLRRALMEEAGFRTWIPVRFDAWKFERSERLWAALAKAVYQQAEASLTPWGWAKFKMRLEIRRRGGRDLGLRLAVLGLLLAAGILTIALGAATAAVAPLLLFVGGAGDTVGRSWGLVADPFKRALDRYAEQPRYEEHLGFTSEADADIRAMTDELTRDPHRALVVFVDDLDRCSPRHIVDVVEAISQIFNSSDSANCAFVIGMDREMVAAGIEVAYTDTIAKLPIERQEDFGRTFLSKLVQISVTLPAPSAEGIDRLLASIIGSAEPDGEPPPDEVEMMRAVLARSDADSAAGVHRAAEDLEAADLGIARDPEALEEAVRLERARFFRRDSEDVRDAERLLIQHLDPNPREIKRFDNAFRLQLHVANGTRDCGLDFDLDDLVVLGKSVVLRLRWPDLGAAIDADPSLLTQLEQLSNGGQVPAETAAEEWSRRPGLVELLQDAPGRRLSRLSQRTFLRVS